ncbi:hypothetical protein [Mycolicibacterium brumae]|uniref:Uncharacterized protein n=1 Tax=Mycolicibacterium brumae TaxID=85968 RepID=A0A2G5PBH3_9MYCO|nr:hypothetical protein [Mycolicibacterium brumae]MCV7191486.1 hypothetical protein [Mycolicibacterium brumae]PIB75708.1 hypothetical protein CQY22_008180 [Mycolicibacterium brumae]RWA16199.1 hypothetical protein MBRU_08815 [Mycolicibacterium brumae DSM 44177]UWW09407.1 hypothetical protein L2Z93_002504 [Mycolicibacterium brumae]
MTWTEYERLTAFTRQLQNVSEALRVKGRTLSADVLHDEAVHFAGERDIARRMAEAEAELADGGPGRDLGELPEDG